MPLGWAFTQKLSQNKSTLFPSFIKDEGYKVFFFGLVPRGRVMALLLFLSFDSTFVSGPSQEKIRDDPAILSGIKLN